MNRRDFSRKDFWQPVFSLPAAVDLRRQSTAYQLAQDALLSADIRRAPAEVREAYRFAISNRDTLRYIPCYCGCGSNEPCLRHLHRNHA